MSFLFHGKSVNGTCESVNDISDNLIVTANLALFTTVHQFFNSSNKRFLQKHLKLSLRFTIFTIPEDNLFFRSIHKLITIRL